MQRALIGILLLLVVLPAFELPIRFTNDARDSGLTVPNTFGGRLKKDYILETTGNGVAIFDYDGDGSNDILITNGTVIDRPPSHSPALPHLYKNDGTGHFTERAREAGLTQDGWGQGVCVGDYDNDGWPDLLLTYYGHNLLYRNLGNGRFADVTRAAGLPVDDTRWGSGCTFLDYDRDGRLDIFVSNYVDLDLGRTPKPGDNENCVWKGLAVMCGPRGLPMTRNVVD